MTTTCPNSQELYRQTFVDILTLNVIVECAVFVAVFIEKSECVGIGKVLKLDKAIHPIPAGLKRKAQKIKRASSVGVCSVEVCSF